MRDSARICVLPRTPHSSPGAHAAIEAAIRSGGGQVSEIEHADGIVWTDWSDPAGLGAVLEAHRQPRWVQLVTSGVDSFGPVIDDRCIWTSAKAAYAEPMAEYVLAMLLAGLRNVPGYTRRRRWEQQPIRSLFGSRVTILGGGGVAIALLRLLEPFGVQVDVVRRGPTPVPGAARTVGLDRLPELAPETDVLVLALALTAETEYLVDAALLKLLRDGAWLVNVARGRHVVTDDLTAALREGRLGGAVLDVTDPEPLPADHPLWQQSNCLITPHASCPAYIAEPYLLRRITDNVARLGAGQELIGVVNPRDGY